MSFCEISFKRKDNSIEVKNNKGDFSPLYISLLQYTSTNDVYTGREWFFDRLIQQSKLKSTNPSELALGLYSIAFNSGKSESYWLSKIDQLLPAIASKPETEDVVKEIIAEDNQEPNNSLVIDRSVVIENNAKQSLLQPSELRQEMFNNWRDYYDGYDDLSDEEKIQFIELVESGLLEIQCKI